MQKADNMIMALDIGHSKVVALIAEIQHDQPRILGCGYAYHNGLYSGSVVHMGELIQAIYAAVEDSKRAAGILINSAYASFSSDQITFIPGESSLIINGEIQAQHIEHVIAQASNTLPQYSLNTIIHKETIYTIDKIKDIKNPLGLQARHLQVSVDFSSIPSKIIRNLDTCCRKAGITVKRLILGGYASAKATLHQDSLMDGALLVDTGHGMNDSILFVNGLVCALDTIDFGGHVLNQRLALNLKLPVLEAEKYKKESMHNAKARSVMNDYFEQLFSKIKFKIEKTIPLHNLRGGIFFTGGNTLLEGFQGYAQRILGPVQCVAPQIDISMPLPPATLSGAIGILMFAMENSNSK